MTRPAEPRLPCLVPFCGRTHANKEGYAEWICGKHYALTDRRLRALRRKALRLGRLSVAELLWCRLREQALSRAAGI